MKLPGYKRGYEDGYNDGSRHGMEFLGNVIKGSMIDGKRVIKVGQHFFNVSPCEDPAGNGIPLHK